MTVTLALTACLALVRTGTLKAGDWAGFLGGPLRTACADERDLLPTWPAEGPPLLWEAGGLGQGYGEILVVGDNVFTWGNVDRNSNVLQCLDIKNGWPRWRVDAPPTNCDSTPAWDSGRLYMQSKGSLYCHDAGNGRLLWQTNLHRVLLEAGIRPVTIPTPYYAGAWMQSPLTVDGMVIAVTGQPRALVVALDAITGKLRWLSQGEKQAIGISWSSASLIRCGQRKIILAPCTGDLVAVDPTNGKVLWEQRCYAPERSANGYIYSWACPPVHADGLLFVFAGYKEPEWSTFRPAADGSSLARAWEKRRIHPNQENVIAAGGRLFGSGSITWRDIDENPDLMLAGKPAKEFPEDTRKQWHARNSKDPDAPFSLRDISPGNTLVCQDLKTGTVLGARGVLAVAGHSHHLLTYADGRLYVAVSNHPEAVQLIEASPKLAIHGTLNLPDMTEGQTADKWGAGFFVRPQVAYGRLFVRVRDRMRVYDLRLSSAKAPPLPDEAARLEAVVQLAKQPPASAMSGLVAALADPCERVRARALAALIQSGSKAVPVMVQALASQNAPARLCAVQFFAKMPARESVGPLIQMLGDQHMDIRLAATDALAAAGPEVVPAAVQALQSEKSLVRQGAATLLGRRGDEKTIAPLMEALGDSVPEVRTNAAQALGRIGTAVTASIRKVIEDEQGVRREEGIEVAGLLGEKGKELVPALLPLLQSPDASLRLRVMRALGAIGPASVEAMPAMFQTAREADPVTQAGLVAAMSKIDPTAPDLELLVLVQNLRTCPTAQIAANAEAVAAKGERIVPLLIRMLDVYSPRPAGRAAVALGKIGPPAKAAVPPLKDLLAKTDDRPLQVAIKDSLKLIEADPPQRSAAP
jgi:HEAT repeat protein/outer membrane protein assembly factor BamB